MRRESVSECSEALRVDQGHEAIGPHGPRPPAITNRGVAKFQGSEDTLVLSLYIQWDENWEKTQAFLEERKLAALNDKESEGGFFEIGGWVCAVRPQGSGGGKNGPYRAYVIEAVGLQFEFSRVQYPNGETPNGKLTAGSLTCMSLRPLGVLKLATEFIEALGGRVLADKLSRIDGAIDLPNVGVEEFIEAYRERRYLCRARKFKLIGEGQTGQTLTFGTSPMVRIYDKLRELSDSPNPAKLEFLILNRWGGGVPDKATRVEFQLRRDDIKSIEFDGRSINSLEDYLECRAGLWSYLCNWFRLTKEPVDENHRDRAETSERWQDVGESFAAWASSPVESVTRVSHVRAIDEKTLMRMLVGCGISMCSNESDFSMKMLEHTVLRAVRGMTEEYGPEELKRRWFNKRQRQLAAVPPDRDRKGYSKPKVRSFDSWLAEEEAYQAEVERCGGQMPFRYRDDPLQFMDLKTIVGE